MDPRITLLKDVFAHQAGAGFDFPVFAGRQFGNGFNYPVFYGRGAQYGSGIGDVFRGIWRFFRPVAMKGAQTLLKAGSEAIKDGATVKDVLTSTLKPTLGAVLGATAEQVASRFGAEKPSAAPPPAPPNEEPGNAMVGTQRGSGRRKQSHPVYKSVSKGAKRYAAQRPIIYNF